MRFGWDGYVLLAIQLVGLVGLPLLAGLGLLMAARRRRRLREAVAEPVLGRLTRSLSPGRRRWKRVLQGVALALVVLSLARPQWGVRSELRQIRGTDVMVVFDVSLSMDARDPPPSRLDKARREVVRILERLEGDRVGLVAFAGSAFVQCPLTSDYGALRLFLDALDTGVILDQGTHIGEALDVAVRAFGSDPSSDRVLLLFTDGEQTVGQAAEAARRAAEAGVTVYALGLGGTSGEPIPLEGDRESGGYKRDDQGQVVVSRLDEPTLREVARITGGAYYRATPGEEEVDAIARHVTAAQDRDMESRLHRRHTERYQPFLLLAVVLLGIEGILTERRRGEEGTA